MAQKRKVQKGAVELVPLDESRFRRYNLPARLIAPLADEIAKTVVRRLPAVLPRSRRRSSPKKPHKAERGVFLDTSAIIDGRIFDVIATGLLVSAIVIPDSILNELKHIADSQDMVKRERGRRGLERLEESKKIKGITVLVLPEDEKILKNKRVEIDEKLIKSAKYYKGRIITGDYNLEKKAKIEGIRAINIHELANSLKITAVPGESLHMQILHTGKDPSQGVGYLDDGTMIVVEHGSEDINKTVNVVVSRVIQTASGRILFAKKI